MKTHQVIVLLVLILCPALLFACVRTRSVETPVTELFPASVIKGATENGTTYYVYDHDFDDTVDANDILEIGLVVRAGSVLERDDQLGLAHFVEHMAFNGTERFPENTLISELGKRGVRFGNDLNAYTSFDNTAFYMDIPNTEENLLFALDVLKEWAVGITYDDTAIEKEKPVVLEEVRARQSKQHTIYKENYAFFFGESLYATRFPSGKMDVIDNAPRDVIKAFYDDWYTPNLMAVYIKGDIDTDFTIQEIAKRFSYEDSHATLPKLEIPLGTPNTMVLRQVADETQNNTATLGFVIPKKEPRTALDVVDSTLSLISGEVIRKHLSSLVEAGTLISTNTATDHIGTSYSMFQITYAVLESQYKEGVAAVFNTIAALKNNPVEDTVLSDIANQLKEWLDTWSEYHTYDFLRDFVNHDPIIDNTKYQNQVFSEIKKRITPEAVQQRIQYMLTQSEMRMITSATKQEVLPSENEVRALYQDIFISGNSMLSSVRSTDEINAHIDETLKGLSAGAIASQKRHDTYDNEYFFTLDNGITVEYYRDKTLEDVLNIKIHGFGGIAHYFKKNDVADYIIARNFNTFLQKLSYAGLSSQETETYEDNNDLTSYFNLGIDNQTINIYGDKNKIEAFFRLPYLYFTSTSQNPNQNNAILNTIAARTTRIKTNPNIYFFSKLLAISRIDDPYGNSFEKQFDYPVTTQEIDRAYQIYNAIMAHPQNFTFSIYGDVPVRTIKKYIKKYIGSLPQGANQQLQPYTPIRQDEFDIVETFPDTEQALIAFGWVNNLAPTPLDAHIVLRVKYLETLITNMLNKVIREEEAGVYAISPTIQFTPELSVPFIQDNRHPIRTGLFVVFGSLPSRIKELKEKSTAIIEQLRDLPIDPEIQERTNAEMVRWIEEGNYDEVFKTYSHELYLTQKFSSASITKDLLQLLDTVTIEEVQQLLKDMTHTPHTISFSLLPQEYSKQSIE